MLDSISASISEAIRDDLSWDEKWKKEDKGLIRCWEQGRLYAIQYPDKAALALKGELIPLVWRGGVEKKTKLDYKNGTLFYLAM